MNNTSSQIRNNSSQQLLIRSIIYLLVGVSAIRGVVVYFNEWPTLVVVLLPFVLLLALERQFVTLPPIFKFLFVAIQVGLVGLLYRVAPLADYWAILLLPACYYALQHFNARIGYLIVGAMSLAIVVMIWVAEGGINSLLFSSVYAVAYLMVAAFSRIIHQLIQARDDAEALSQQLELANQRLRDYSEQVANSAILEERTAVARDLHDSVTQTLFSVNLLLGSLENRYRLEPEGLRQDIAKIEGQSESAMKELRAIIHQLKPAKAQIQNFSDALQQLISELAEHYGLRVTQQLNELEVPRFARQKLLQIIREALINVIKHSGESQAEITLQNTGELLVLAIQDTGCGFNTETGAEQGHMGLESMQLHAHDIGSQLTFDTKPNQGCRVQVSIPQSFPMYQESTQ